MSDIDDYAQLIGAAYDTLDHQDPPDRATYYDSRQALTDHALYYASVGWPVFPLVAGGKTPVTRNGVKDASTDPTTVAEWWRTMPSANIGVACGVTFDVIDIDAPDGFTSWADFVDEMRANNITHPDILAVTRTGSDGAHLYIPAVPGARNGARLGGKTGLDYRATGGYIVAPPSRLTDGKRYAWTTAPDARLLSSAA